MWPVGKTGWEVHGLMTFDAHPDLFLILGLDESRWATRCWCAIRHQLSARRWDTNLSKVNYRTDLVDSTRTLQIPGMIVHCA
jgi:hypothetical protein